MTVATHTCVTTSKQEMKSTIVPTYSSASKKRFWSYIMTKRKNNTGRDGENICADAKHKAHFLNIQFQSKFIKYIVARLFCLPFNTRPQFLNPWYPTTASEVESSQGLWSYALSTANRSCVTGYLLSIHRTCYSPRFA